MLRVPRVQWLLALVFLSSVSSLYYTFLTSTQSSEAPVVYPFHHGPRPPFHWRNSSSTRRDWTSVDQCELAQHVHPFCTATRATKICHVRNLCHYRSYRGPRVSDHWVAFTDSAGSSAAMLLVDDRPVLAPFGAAFQVELESRSIASFAAQRGLTVVRRAPVALLYEQRELSARKWYEWLVRDMGALFWLAWDVAELDPSVDVDVVLLNRARPTVSFAQAFATGAGRVWHAEDFGRSDLTCFERAVVGSGCRPLWWRADRFAFAPPEYVDFMQLDVAPYKGTVLNEGPVLEYPEHMSPLAGLLPRMLSDTFAGETASKGAALCVAARSRQRRLLTLASLVVRVATDARFARLFDHVKIVAPSERRLVLEEPGDGLPIRVVRYNSGSPGSLPEQAKAYHDCSVLVGVHGAGLSNMVFMPQGRAVMELFGHWHRNACFQVLAGALEFAYTAWRPPASSPLVASEACRATYVADCKSVDFELSEAEEQSVVDRLADLLHKISLH